MIDRAGCKFDIGSKSIGVGCRLSCTIENCNWAYIPGRGMTVAEIECKGED